MPARRTCQRWQARQRPLRSATLKGGCHAAECSPLLTSAAVSGSAAAAHPAESVKQAAKFVGAAAGAAIGAAITLQLKAKRQSAAIIELANTLVSLGDPTALTREQVGGRLGGPNRGHAAACALTGQATALAWPSTGGEHEHGLELSCRPAACRQASHEAIHGGLCRCVPWRRAGGCH